MKFEKLNENKIRITLTVQDLAEKEIDFNVFMSNSEKTQDILLDMLEEAKKETGFDPEDNNLKIEALVMADSNFIFTITKLPYDNKAKNLKNKFTAKRKSISPTSSQAIYVFNCFDDFDDFLVFLGSDISANFAKSLAKSVILYEYKGKYYLLMNNINSKLIEEIKFYACITEFAKYVPNSNVFTSKLKEYGNVIMKNNALEIGIKHFAISKKSGC